MMYARRQKWLLLMSCQRGPGMPLSDRIVLNNDLGQVYAMVLKIR
jgi:hypothetical protein